jgi:riboflavin-specific deaminase-like protein
MAAHQAGARQPQPSQAVPQQPMPQQAVREQAPVRLRRLLPPGDDESALQVAEALAPVGERARAEGRPYLILNMIASADGRATLGGRSGPLGDTADRELFHALRAVTDAVLVGAGTVRTERYGRMIKDPGARERRREQGRSEEPLACIVSGRLDLPEDLPLLGTQQARVVIVTSSQTSLAAPAAHVEYVRAERDGMLDLHAAVRELRDRYSVEVLLCEGGPHLNASLFADGLADELLLTLAPKLAGGAPPTCQALRVLAGPPLPAPVELELVGVLESASQLFLRYAVRA